MAIKDNSKRKNPLEDTYWGEMARADKAKMEAEADSDKIKEEETSPRNVPIQRPYSTSTTDVGNTNVYNNEDSNDSIVLDIHNVATYIYDLDLLRTNIPVTLSQEERSIIDRLLLDDLRNVSQSYKAIGVSRLMRLCTMYMIKYHKRELLLALNKHLTKAKKKSIF